MNGLTGNGICGAGWHSPLGRPRHELAAGKDRLRHGRSGFFSRLTVGKRPAGNKWEPREPALSRHTSTCSDNLQRSSMIRSWVGVSGFARVGAARCRVPGGLVPGLMRAENAMPIVSCRGRSSQHHWWPHHGPYGRLTAVGWQPAGPSPHRTVDQAINGFSSV